ncbi:IclR family transcriptional regulator [Paracoccus gahaiensis]|nr:IclR family transcriptional regulator [Paracoccus gahaiensis]
MTPQLSMIQHMDPRDGNGTQSVDRALMLLQRLGAEGRTLAALVSDTGLNKATVRRLLLALIRAGLVEQDEARRTYHLGEQLQVLGAQAARRPGLMAAAGESVMRLAQVTGDAALLSVRRGASALCLMREEGSHPLRSHALVAGQSHPLGVGAGSLAMLASLPDDQVATVLSAIAPALAERYPNLPPDRLQAMVARTRAEGVALNPGLVLEGSWGLGIALHHPGGGLAGALSIAAVEARMRADRLPDLIHALRAEAARIQTRLAQTAPRPGRET